MNWKNDGIWLLLLIPIIGLSFGLGVGISSNYVSLLIVATIIILFIIRWKFRQNHKE